MSITTTWSINTLKRETTDGYVYDAHYDVNATDGTYAARSYGSVGLSKPDTLIPYADITETTAVAWVKAKLDEDEAGTVSRIEASLAARINEQKTPTKASGVPW